METLSAEKSTFFQKLDYLRLLQTLFQAERCTFLEKKSCRSLFIGLDFNLKKHMIVVLISMKNIYNNRSNNTF